MVCKSGEALIQPQILHAVAGLARGALYVKPQNGRIHQNHLRLWQKTHLIGVERLTCNSGCCSARQIVRMDAKQRFSLKEIICAVNHDKV